MKLKAYGDKLVIVTETLEGVVKGEQRTNSGVVESIGSEVVGIKVGDIVMFEGIIFATDNGYITNQANILAIYE